MSITKLLVGAVFLFSQLAGSAQWTTQNIGSDRNIDDLEFYSSSSGYIIVDNFVSNGSPGGIYKTTDSGLTWQNVFAMSSSNTNNLTALSVVDSFNCFVSDFGGYIFSTNDGGISWDTISTGLNNYIISIDFFTPEYGIVTGDFGSVMVTIDGGATWMTTSTPTADYLSRVQIIDDTTAFIVGTPGTPGANGSIFKSSDGIGLLFCNKLKIEYYL